MGKRSISLLRTGPTGPRTPRGKARSKFNALKDGIFSTAAVLETESPWEYAQLVSELVAVLQPVGRLEEVLVEKIATTLWRSRRLLRAEAAEIETAALLGEKTFARVVSDYQLASAFYPQAGSLQRALLSHNAPGLFSAVDQLKRLRERLLKGGLDWNRDLADLQELFGKAQLEEAEENDSRAEDATVPAFYRALFRENEEAGRNPKSEQCEIVVDRLDQAIEFFERKAEEESYRSRKLERLRADRCQVLEEKASDRFIRREVHLDRALDRALSQLERLQRMRLGQPVLPPVKVEVSH